MSEIRREVIKRILKETSISHLDLVTVLSDETIAIVDRKAELPKEPEACGMREQFEDILSGYRMAQTDMLNAGWLKEVL